MKPQLKLPKLKNIWFILVVLALHLLVVSCYEESAFMGDTPSYLNYPQNILRGEINPSRTPIYPYFIKLSTLLIGDPIHGTIVFQTILSLATIVVFYLISLRLFKSPVTARVTTLFFSCNPSLASWDKCILTESLSITLIVLMLWQVILLVDQPGIKRMIMITFLVLLSIFTRPSFVLLIPVFIVFWFILFGLKKLDQRLLVIGLFSQLFIGICILLYSFGNSQQNGYFSLSNIPIGNVVRILAENNLHQHGNDQEITNILESYLNGEPTEKTVYDLPNNRVYQFVKTAILNQPGKFSLICFKKFFILNSSTISVHFAQQKSHAAGYLIPRLFLALTSLPFYIIHLALVIGLIWFIRQFKTQSINTFFSFVSLFVFQQLVMIYLAAPSEYFRLFVPAIPAALLMCGFLVERYILPKNFIEENPKVR